MTNDESPSGKTIILLGSVRCCVSDDSSIQAAKEAVLGFAQAWTAWELQMALDDGSLHDPAMRQMHARLITGHCTIKKRAYVDGLLTYGRPPTYADVIATNIFNVELHAANKAYVDAKCPRMFYRFVVQKKRDGWRIASIKWKVIETDEWIIGLIGM